MITALFGDLFGGGFSQPISSSSGDASAGISTPVQINSPFNVGGGSIKNDNQQDAKAEGLSNDIGGAKALIPATVGYAIVAAVGLIGFVFILKK